MIASSGCTKSLINIFLIKCIIMPKEEEIYPLETGFIILDTLWYVGEMFIKDDNDEFNELTVEFRLKDVCSIRDMIYKDKAYTLVRTYQGDQFEIVESREVLGNVIRSLIDRPHFVAQGNNE